MELVTHPRWVRSHACTMLHRHRNAPCPDDGTTSPKRLCRCRADPKFFSCGAGAARPPIDRQPASPPARDRARPHTAGPSERECQPHSCRPGLPTVGTGGAQRSQRREEGRHSHSAATARGLMRSAVVTMAGIQGLTDRLASVSRRRHTGSPPRRSGHPPPRVTWTRRRLQRSPRRWAEHVRAHG